VYEKLGQVTAAVWTTLLWFAVTLIANAGCVTATVWAAATLWFVVIAASE
jgi:hypothetical protein